MLVQSNNLETELQITKNLIETTLPDSVLEQVDWLDKMGNALEQWSSLENVTTMVQAEILYRVYMLWDSKLSKEVTAKYNHDYFVWAARLRSTSKEPAKVTIENKITVYRDWVGEQIIECPETVYIPKRDENGKVIDKTLNPDKAWDEVPFDPSQCDYGKLLVSRGAARRKELTPEAWSAIADPYATVGDVKAAIAETKPHVQGKPGMRIVEEEGIIYARENGDKVAVLQIIFDDSGNPLFAKALSHALNTLGLPVPLHYR